MTEELLESINKRMALLIKANLSSDLEGMTRVQQVEFLEEMDFRDEDITEVLGITDNHLRTIRSNMEE